MKTKQFTGLGTALITPLDHDGRIDWIAMTRLVEQQIAGGVDHLTPGGTTGGAPTLTPEEHIQVIKFVVKAAAGRVSILAGTGSNSTAEAINLTVAAKRVGADGALVVVPYYIKPTIEGLMAHYRELAKVGLPIFLYDIPGRCGGNMVPAEVILELANEGTIVGLKWASGNLDQLQDVLAERPKNFTVLSGDDNLTFSAMCLGADGVISVLSNLLPERMAKFISVMSKPRHKFGKLDGREEHFRLLPLMRAMFMKTNPIPITTALVMVYPDIFWEAFRLPLMGMKAEDRGKLREVLQAYDLPINKRNQKL